MRALCLTGWMQPYHALVGFAEALGYEAEILPYGDVADMALLRKEPQVVDLAIGWSLGGGLLCHGLADGWIKASRVLLVATPFSLSETRGYREFLALYHQNPELAAEWLSRRIGVTDKCDGDWRDTAIAGAWLELLAAPFTEKVKAMPAMKMAVLHATDDAVVPFAHGEKLAKTLHASLIKLDKGGHAPFKEIQAVDAVKGWLNERL